MTTNRKPHARFRLVLKSATLDDLERLVKSSSKFVFFSYTESAITSILGINNIFGEGHTIGDMYKPWLLNILRLGIFNSYDLLKSI